MRELLVLEAEQNQRLDKYLKKYLNKAPGSFIYKMLRKKNIKLNKKKADGNELLNAGDQIQLFLSDDTIDSFREILHSRKVPLPEVIYEDSHIILLNKPAGLLTQKAEPKDLSLVDELLYYLEQTGKYDPAAGKAKPSVCNRLDRNTSGLVLAGIDLAGLQYLSAALKERTLKKEYLCIVKGVVEQPIHVKGYLAKDEHTNTVCVSEKPIEGASFVETYFTPLSNNKKLTLIRADLITGKTHQIRSHLAFLGHPIIGDTKYGDTWINQIYRKKYGIKYQLLHAAYVTFPKQDTIFSYLSGHTFSAPLPKQFEQCRIGEGLHE